MEASVWNRVLLFLLQNLISLILIALLLRAYIQWLHLPARNPFVQFVFKLTHFVIGPLQRLLSRTTGLNIAIILLAAVLQILLTLAEYALMGFPFAVAGSGVLPGFLVLALTRLLTLANHMIMGIVLAGAILSMVDPFSTLAASFDALTAPLLRPFRKIVPITGNIDWSPMFLLIICELIDMFPVVWLTQWAHQMI